MPLIAINLLPGAAAAPRGKPGWPSLKSLKLPQGTPLIVLGVAGGLLVLAVVILVVLGASQQHSFGRVKQEWSALAGQREALEHLQAEAQSLDSRRRVLQDLVTTRRTWAKPLNRIADQMPDGVWLTRLVVAPPSDLILEGSALERSGAGMQSVSGLLTSLQADESFTSVFNKITLQSVTTRTAGHTEVVDFKITCAVVEPPAPPAPPETRKNKDGRRSRKKTKK